jgi:hypothetical protein
MGTAAMMSISTSVNHVMILLGREGACRTWVSLSIADFEVWVGE